MKPLSADEIRQQLGSLPGWVLRQDTLAKEFLHPDPAAARAFGDAVGELAELTGQRPVIQVTDTRVTVILTSASGGGVSWLDIKLARQIENIGPAP
jgi:pterin-4a-carbinolamine dehydratase